MIRELQSKPDQVLKCVSNAPDETTCAGLHVNSNCWQQGKLPVHQTEVIFTGARWSVCALDDCMVLAVVLYIARLTIYVACR